MTLQCKRPQIRVELLLSSGSSRASGRSPVAQERGFLPGGGALAAAENSKASGGRRAQAGGKTEAKSEQTEGKSEQSEQTASKQRAFAEGTWRRKVGARGKHPSPRPNRRKNTHGRRGALPK